MKAKDILFGILAGFVLIIFWYGQFAIGFIEAIGSVNLFVYPIIPAACLVVLLKHKRLRYFVAKLGIFVGSSFFFFSLGDWVRLHYRMLNLFIPDYGRMSAGGGFSLMFESLFYFGISGLAILLSLCLCKFDDKPAV